MTRLETDLIWSRRWMAPPTSSSRLPIAKKRNPVHAFHHLHAAAGSCPQIAVPAAEAHHDAGAEALNEGVELSAEEGATGLISYMRTDSTRVSADALDEVRKTIEERYGADYRPAAPNVYKSQEGRAGRCAHEAIRTHLWL